MIHIGNNGTVTELWAVARVYNGGNLIWSAPWASGSFGALAVTYSGTAPSGAQWSVDSGDNWNDFGDSVSLATGSYTITYKAVSGYIVPSSQSSTVTAGETTSVTAGAYTAQQNQFVAAYTVSGASDATANGGYWLDSSHKGRNNSPVWTNGTYYLTHGWDGDMDDPGWAVTTAVPNGTNTYNQTPQYWVVSNNSSAPPTSGWSNGVTVTQGS